MAVLEEREDGDVGGMRCRRQTFYTLAQPLRSIDEQACVFRPSSQRWEGHEDERQDGTTGVHTLAVHRSLQDGAPPLARVHVRQDRKREQEITLKRNREGRLWKTWYPNLIAIAGHEEPCAKRTLPSPDTRIWMSDSVTRSQGKSLHE